MIETIKCDRTGDHYSINYDNVMYIGESRTHNTITFHFINGGTLTIHKYLKDLNIDKQKIQS